MKNNLHINGLVIVGIVLILMSILAFIAAYKASKIPVDFRHDPKFCFSTQAGCGYSK